MPNAAIRTDNAADPAVRTYRLGTVTATITPHYLPGIGPREFLVLEERGSRYSVPFTPQNARLLAAGLIAGACEAEARERKAREREAAKPKDGGVLMSLEQLLAVSQKA